MPPQIEDIRGRGPSMIETFVLTPPSGRRDLGIAAIIADFGDLPESLRYLGARIAGAVKQEYFGDAAGSAAQRVARALRAANDALAQEAAAGTAQWVGTLRAAVAVAANGELFVSSTGGCVVLFCRNGTVTEVPLESGEGSRPFGAVTSGPLDPGDDILVAPRTILGLRDVETELSGNPARLYGWIRRSDGIACLRIASETLPSRGLLSRITLPRRPAFRLPRFLPSPFLRDRQKRARLTLRERLRGRFFPRVHGVAGTFRLLRGAARTPMLLLKIAARGRSVGRAPRRTMMIFAGTAALLAAVWGATLLMPQSERVEPRATALDAARAALERGEAQNILGDSEGAVLEYETGMTALQGADEPDAQNLHAELVARRNDILGIREAEAERIIAFSGFPLPLNPQRIAVVSDPETPDTTILAIAGPEFSSLWVHDRLEATGGTFLFLPPPLRGGILDLTKLNGAPLIAALADDGVALIEPKSRTVLSAVPRSEAQPLAVLAGGTGQIFAVSPASETIKRINVAADGTLTEQPWLRPDDPALTRARDAVVMGDDLVVLLDDNTFVRYRNGRRMALYRIEGRGWEGDARALAVFPDGRLLILDNANIRLLVTNEIGDVESQIATEALAGGRDLALTPDASSVFILTTDAIVRVTLPRE